MTQVAGGVEPATLRRDEALGDDVWTLNFGPQHPATHTTLQLVLQVDGERVIGCTPHIGYLHSGFEKLGEDLNYNQYVVVTDRMNYISPIVNNVAWHHAVEKLFGIEITPRCKALRTIVAELGRIQDHLLCVGAQALDLGALTGFLYGFNEREPIYDLLEALCGARFTVSYTRVGGVMSDAPPGWLDNVRRYLRETLPPALRDFENLLVRNRIFIERCKGIGVISHDDAVNWSLTGPCARASGVRRDLRKDEPYLCYADNWDGRGAPAVKFKVPISYGGDVLARFQVRVEEIRQSAAIIEQVIDMMPEGPVNVVADAKATIPDKREIYFSIEGLIAHFEKIMTNRGWRPPIGEAYGAIESPTGELGFHLASDGGNAAYRARCRPPSFINYQCFPKLILGHQISDVVAVLGSLQIIAAELDR
ncbi:MAG: NADH-quinone oxidoreductase subunit D [Phycisphaerae bacterium]|nr:NADH-quinone oxidoreductase subunit D [Phycisphaerae bacterium]MCZ2399771.1 NADH-quinone oxidoreductase subunit D [Phycisphaerae bacterium]